MAIFRAIPLFLACGLFAAVHSEPETAVRRVQAHLIIKDYQLAYQEALQGVQLYPDSAPLQEELIKSLAKLGQEKEMLQQWNHYVKAFPDKAENRLLIEEMAWGVLNKASRSPSLLARLMGMLAAFFSQDAKGVEILHQSMHDSNAAIRSIAVKLASHYRDVKLKDDIKRLFKEEPAWIVRKETIEAIGQMKITELRTDLEALIASDQSLAEEKALAIEALVELLDDVKRDEMVRLASANRAGLRLLACQAIAHFRSFRDLDLLLKLGDDYHADVRAAAFQALGLVRPLGSQDALCVLARKHLNDSNPVAAISAAWLLTLYRPQEGQWALQKYLNAQQPEVRIIAAGALAATGRYGAPLADQFFQTHKDPYVRINLALGLLGQRMHVLEASTVIDTIMTNETEKWVWKEQGIFRAVSPRSLQKADEDEPEVTPEADNQLIRLKLLNQLAMVHYPTAQDSIRRFLAERTWGVSGVAAALLLTEGDDYAVDLVKGLLTDSNPKIQLQAALILSLWSREEGAIQTLENAYWNVDRESKEKILEGLGRIGSMRSVPFLIEVLREPSQGLRIIAAMALIECLNH